MFTLYSFLLFLILLLLSPYFVLQALRHGKYFVNLWERSGRLPKGLQQSVRGAIWIHAVSVGESNAVIPLVTQLRKHRGEQKLFVSTTTRTGQENARKKLTAADGIFYYPFDWRWTVRRSLSHIQPALVCLTETELWPNFIREAHHQGIRLVLINGRISPRSFRWYRRWQFFLMQFLPLMDCCLMQSEEDAERIRALGMPPERVFVSGNLKYDLSLERPASAAVEQIRQSFLGAGSSPVWVAGSTAEGEEEIVLRAFQTVRAQHPDARLILAPRKPERFDAVAALLEIQGVRFVRRTQLNHPSGLDCAVLLLDSIGELASVYDLATVAFVGGSLVERGGHNILEPAAVGVPVLFGPHMMNFKKMAEDFLAHDAAIQVNGGKRLAQEVLTLLREPQRAQALAQRGRALIARSSGATRRTVEKILELL